MLVCTACVQSSVPCRLVVTHIIPASGQKRGRDVLHTSVSGSTLKTFQIHLVHPPSEILTCVGLSGTTLIFSVQRLL